MKIGSFITSCVKVPASPDETADFLDYCDMFLTFETNPDGPFTTTVAVSGFIYDDEDPQDGEPQGEFLVQGAGAEFADRYNGVMETYWHAEVFAEAYLFLTADDLFR